MTEINYLDELTKIKLNRSGSSVSLHKPLLLLLLLSKISKGMENTFLYDDLEDQLKYLLRKYGLRNSKTLNPQYPFIYLAGSKTIWECSISKNSLRYPDAASRDELLGVYGHFTVDFYNFLLPKGNLEVVVIFLLNSYWTEAYHQEILDDLGIEIKKPDTLFQAMTFESKRSQKFVEDVLKSYQYKCAICFQSIRLGGSPIGIDACHLKPIQHFGDDLISNGLALCKSHHWALDRGAISLNFDYRIVLSPKLSGDRIEEHFFVFENAEIFKPQDQTKWLSQSNIDYHFKYLFEKEQ